MKINKNTLIGFGGLTLITLGIGVLYFNNRKPKTKTTGVTTRGGSSDVDDSAESVFPLEEGSKGDEVKLVQQYLNRSSSCAKKMPKSSPTARIRKLLPLDEDGIFGEKTGIVLNLCYKTSSISESVFNNMKKALKKITINE